MYHFDVSWGESPDLATVKEAPLESYEGLPCEVKESEAPEVKSIVTDFPSAVSGGQLPIMGSASFCVICLSVQATYRS